MSTAGYNLKFGKGYLGGRKEPGETARPEREAHQPGSHIDEESHHAAIHEHLKDMHEATGHAHSHIEHHGDGRHTSHHIDASGSVSGPHDHENLEALKDHMGQFLDEEGQEGDEGEDEQEA